MTLPNGEILTEAIEQLVKPDPIIDSVNELTLPSILAASSMDRSKIVIKIVRVPD